VQFDVEAGLCSADGARRYGVVLRDDLSVDTTATDALRGRMRAERGAKKLFDRGFASIDELKRRAKAETGLEPPVQPQFLRRVARDSKVA
jgi:N-methylhydantoinase B